MPSGLRRSASRHASVSTRSRTRPWPSRTSATSRNVFDVDTLEASRYQSDSAAHLFFFQLASSEAVLPNERQFGVTASSRF
jgi:hypothetical protein